jgi:predicted ATPase
MEAMRNAAELARAGRGQLIAAMAEAGTGKSRLFFEFKAKNQSGWMVLETFSVSHGKASAYFPVIDLLHGYFGIDAGDDSRKRREKVTGRVVALDRSLEDTLSYLFGLLGIADGDDPLAQMDAQVRKRRTLDAIKRILLRESLNQPLMVIFEDLHWIDEETQAFLNLLADSIGTAKILLLVNYRPEYSHQWNSKTYYTQLRLDPLGKESADEMLAALLGDGVEMAQLKRVIIEKTEGNPFFMEETVQVLLDEGALVRDGSSARLTKALGELKIPPTVQAILAARIDRLPADEKDLLQALAVIGREFPLSLIREVVAKSDDELNRMLSDLQLGEFIYEQPAMGDVEYTFKHGADPGGRLQLGADGTAPSAPRSCRRSYRSTLRRPSRRSPGKTGASLRPQRQRRQSFAVPDAGWQTVARALRPQRIFSAVAERTRVAQNDARIAGARGARTRSRKHSSHGAVAHQGTRFGRDARGSHSRCYTGRENRQPRSAHHATKSGSG